MTGMNMTLRRSFCTTISHMAQTVNPSQCMPSQRRQVCTLPNAHNAHKLIMSHHIYKVAHTFMHTHVLIRMHVPAHSPLSAWRAWCLCSCEAAGAAAPGGPADGQAVPAGARGCAHAGHGRLAAAPRPPLPCRHRRGVDRPGAAGNAGRHVSGGARRKMACPSLHYLSLNADSHSWDKLPLNTRCSACLVCTGLFSPWDQHLNLEGHTRRTPRVLGLVLHCLLACACDRDGCGCI